jgi:hypothetical protein
MLRILSGVVLATAVSLQGAALPAPAWAAAPPAFKAKGHVHSITDGESQDMNVAVSYKSGKVRVETMSKDIGKSIMVAHKGKDSVAMLDPDQKMIVRMKPSAMRGAAQDDVPQFDVLLDPGGFKKMVEKEGRKVGPGDAILGHKTTIWERTQKSGKMRVWLADDVDLPLRMEGKSNKGDSFKLAISALDLKPTFGKDDFNDAPSGYQEISAEETGGKN